MYLFTRKNNVMITTGTLAMGMRTGMLLFLHFYRQPVVVQPLI